MKERCSTCGELLTASEQVPHCPALPPQKPIWQALGYLPRGLKMVILQNQLRQLSLWPLLITFVVLMGTLYFGLFYVYQQLAFLIETSIQTSWLGQALKSLTVAFSSVALVILFIFLFVPVSSLICIPFLDPLSQAAERQLLGRELTLPPFSFEALMIMLKEMVKLLIFKLILLIICLPLLLIPIFGHLLFLYTLSAQMAIDCLDIILARKGYNFAEKWAYFKANRARFFLFALPLMLMIWVPLLQILLIPAGAVAGAIFYLEAPKTSQADNHV